MRVAVVVNAASGGALGRAGIEAEVARHLAGAGIEPHVVADRGQGLAARIGDAVAHGAAAVVVGGGDGTIAAAAARLAGTGTALGILPLGTMNLLARDLGIPLDLPAAAEALAHGHRRAIDVAEVNGHVFLCASVLGLPSHLGRHRERHRGRASPGARLAFAAAALRAAVQHPPLRLLVDFGDGPVRVWTRAVAVVPNGYAEAPLQVLRRPRLDGGTLTLYVARRFGLWGAARLLLGMAFGAWRDQGLLDEREATSLTIRSARPHLRVMNDGEAALLAPPLRYRVRPRALAVLVPPPAEAAAPPARTAEAA